MNVYKNQRGNAIRDTQKSIRVSTHVPVLELAISTLEPNIFVIEHGMGISSTPFFHKENKITKILSFEDDKRWMTCTDCESGNKKNHTIISFDSFENCKNSISSFAEGEKNIIVLIDGPSHQRIEILKIAQEFSFLHIIEHDVETLDNDELLSRIEISSKNNYMMYQYVKSNPESMYYTFNTIKDNNYIKIN